MQTRHHVIAVALLCALLVAVIANHRASISSAPTLAAAASVVEPEPVSEAARQQELLAYEEQTRARINALEKAATERTQRDQAAEKTHEARDFMRLSKSLAWERVIRTNWHTFQSLRQAAAQSPDKYVPCTICDAKGVMDLCVVCDNTGKCPTCAGSAKVSGNDVCPACLGSGKCFQCFGIGKMPCPFCQSLPNIKEVITPNTPPPPKQMPID